MKTPNQKTLREIAASLHTDPDSLRRTLIVRGLTPSGIAGAEALYDSDTASFLWLAAQVKKSPTRAIQTNIQLTKQPQ
jgi:hypothetical protein